MLRFAVEWLRDIESEVKAITPEHWEMLATNKSEIKLNIDWDFYHGVEAAGKLVICTARTDEGKLAGYYFSVLNVHPHYKDTPFSFLDCYFMLPEYRQMTSGIGFFEYMENVMRNRGVKCIISSTKRHSDVGPLFQRLGWKDVGTTYQKYVGEPVNG